MDQLNLVTLLFRIKFLVKLYDNKNKHEKNQLNKILKKIRAIQKQHLLILEKYVIILWKIK